MSHLVNALQPGATITRIGCAAGLLLLAPSLVAGQAFGLGARYQTYTFDEPTIAGAESVSLFARPVAASFDLPSRFSLGVTAAYAQGVVTGRQLAPPSSE